jgi:DNA-binding CsgD family transcriptional regulator
VNKIYNLENLANNWNQKSHLPNKVRYLEVAKDFNVEVSTLRIALRAANQLGLNLESSENNLYSGLNNDDFSLEELVNKWNTKKYDVRELGKEYGISKGTVRNRLKSAIKLGIHVEQTSQGKAFKVHSRDGIYQSVVNRIEKKSALDSFLEKEILRLRANYLGSKEIARILNISLSKVDFLTIDMSLRGVAIPNSKEPKSNKKNQLQDELLLANSIDSYLEKNLSLSEIVDILGISRYKVQNIIYKHLIRS